MAKTVGKTKIEIGIKKPQEAEPKAKKKKKKKPKKFPKRIRMFRSCANQDMAYIKGHSYKVPEQVSIKTARSWLESETAEEDKSLAGVPEEKK